MLGSLIVLLVGMVHEICGTAPLPLWLCGSASSDAFVPAAGMEVHVPDPVVCSLT